MGFSSAYVGANEGFSVGDEDGKEVGEGVVIPDL